jgi:hypothetical protein
MERSDAETFAVYGDAYTTEIAGNEESAFSARW